MENTKVYVPADVERIRVKIGSTTSEWIAVERDAEGSVTIAVEYETKAVRVRVVGDTDRKKPRRRG